VVAVAAGWYAKRAADAANESLDLARQEVAMGREEHDEFLRELRARARFAGTVKFSQAKDGRARS
jgi:prefoldin subunit 5